MKRRHFLKLGIGSALSAPVILSNRYSMFSATSGSSIVSIEDIFSSSLTFREGTSPNADVMNIDKILSYSVNSARVHAMVDKAILEITGKHKLGKAWESLFPAGRIGKSTKIGIKINFAYGYQDNENDWNEVTCPYGPKISVIEAVVTGLTQMLDGTFPIENITVYDLGITIIPGRVSPVLQGFRPVNQGMNGTYKDQRPGTYTLHWVSNRTEADVPVDAPHFIAAPDYAEPYNAPQKILAPAYQNDFTINIGIAKDHRSAGVTGVMKNTYGCTDNCGNTHGDQWMNAITPYAGTRLCVPVFYKTIDQYAPTILNIMDALAGVYHGGPTTGRVFQPNLIAVSRDPVALDSWLLQMINKARKIHNLSILGVQDGRAEDGHPNAAFLRIASDVHKLGNRSLDNIRHFNISSGKLGYSMPSLQKEQYRLSDPEIHRDRCRMNLFLDDSGRKHFYSSWIEDMQGISIRSFNSRTTRSSSAICEWDLKNERNHQVKAGRYVWHVVSGDIRHSRIINLT